MKILMSNLARIFYGVIIPIILGGLIYVFFRNKNLLMFQWFTNLGLDELINEHRISTLQINFPKWVIYSLPDALWIFSFTNLMLIIWEDEYSARSVVWIYAAPFIGLLSETGQLFRFFPGTFDRIDLILIFLFSLPPYFTSYKLNLLKK